MQFSKLRLSGFKSFVDPTELRIEAGLTGIVGPNGCGKSNLVEALRWVMGENSARSMRGSGMDDVIFAGTSRRPARNLAEVSLTIDNSRRRAPAAFNEEDQLEIVRRIERESGSAYRINGRDVRAKDVQLLFADAATGAHSPAMVSQGRVGALIAAKPKDRRAILEEAAGISGLHSRRREAEQRLKAAENNLVRLQDVLTQLETQSAALKRQARQAERYRTLSNDIRKADAGILYHKWRNALDQARALERNQHEIEQHVGTLTATATKLSAEQTQLAAQLPDLRKAETNAAAHVQRLQMTASQLEADERQRADMLASLERQIQQIQADELREKETHADAKAALSRLDAEQARHKQAQEGQLAAEQAARDHLDTCARKAEEAEAAYDAIGQRLAEARGRRASLSSDLTALERRRDRMARDHQETQAAIHAMEEADPDAQAVKTAEIAVAALEKQIEDRALKLEEAAAKTAQAREEADQKRAALSQSRSNLASNQADRAALEKRLQARNVNGQASIADQLSVHAGFEQALGAALGEDLNAPLDAADAPTVWHSLPPLSQVPQLPDTAIPLSNHVEGPATLTRRLSQIGVVETDAQLQHLVPALLPGQRLVTKSGGLVRWDGYRMAADAPSAATIRLQQKNRLAVLKAESVELEAKVAVAATAHEQAQSAVQNATKAQALQRTHLDEAESAVRAAKQKLAEAEAEANRRASRLAGLTETLARLTQEMNDAQARCKTIKAALAELPLATDLETRSRTAREAVETARHALAQARTNHDTLSREAQSRRDRLSAIETEHRAWEQRLKRAADQLEQLDKRRQTAQAEQVKIKIPPDEFAQKRQSLADQIEQAEATRRQAADQLASAETALAEKDRALKAVQEQLADIRESRARTAAALDAMTAQRQEIARMSGERFQCPPPDILKKLDLGDPAQLPDMETFEEQSTRHKAQRERLGAVNLRADEELREVETQLSHLLEERNDLEQAIGRLRQAIGSLNREGRERLLSAFQEVSRHFSDLFQTLFGGGYARLELVESDDPLDAGIEIMASPPGKKLQILSLLSGGEQALTALSLIFAVFITNPAPICVLDEVDAPLDEANVERLCDLLDGMNARTDTRFLIVTHNEVTMARMHRLFGVTMAERGISQLVSVDLERAESLTAAQ